MQTLKQEFLTMPVRGKVLVDAGVPQIIAAPPIGAQQRSIRRSRCVDE